MLFDLRSKGRRNAIKVIYAGLAVLMGAGLVLFGVGGAVSGGLLDAFNSDSGTSTSDIYEKRVASAEKRVKATPNDAAAWGNLAKVRFQKVAGEQQATDGTFTAKGVKQLSTVEQAWDKYLSLKPAKTDPSLASLMVQALGPAGLSQNDKAVSAMELVLDGRKPTTGLYVQYATLAYLAGQSRKGDLAGEKAVALAPKDLRTQVKAQVDSAKAQATQAAVQSAQQSG